jgi:ornithine--oxo-acid transaminase
MTNTLNLTTSQEYIALEDAYGAPNYDPIDVVIRAARGVWVTDVDGKTYMDCLSGYSAVNQGHCHPVIRDAMVQQMERLTLTSRVFRNDQLGAFFRDLCQLTGYNTVLPMNTGAEAVETAIKAARRWGYQVKGVPDNQAEIIVCQNNFAGRTVTAVSFSTTPQYRDRFGPFTPGFKVIPFGDAEALKNAITPNTVAFLLEPIQGEGGINVPPDGYLKQVRDICTRQNVLMITDEVQTGLGRTGYLLAAQHEDVRADMVTLGKALSGGYYPISAVVADREVLGVFNAGDHGSTFGGNPLAAAVGRAALQVIVEENLAENAATVGTYFIERLAELNSPYIKEVRGRGLLIGVELKDDVGGARRFCEALRVGGILCKDTHEHIIRFAPPLVIKKAEVDWAMERIALVLLGG